MHQVSEESDLESEREEGIWGVDSVEDHGERVPPISVCVQLDGKEVVMELCAYQCYAPPPTPRAGVGIR